ncbi:hypothetical protein T484DRAFT_2084047 [Baffinella frigidus]|nr:hypothetical protein T484DRAFT_2084047 [Cryptophyta sp. CCMP2293]
MEEAGESTRPACSLPAETGAHAASRTAPLESATRDDSFGSGPSFREDGESDAASRHNEEGNVCRYCLECEPWEELIRPCLCTAPVHKSCLSRWIRSGDSQTNRELECELCRAPFRAKLVPAPFSALLFTGEGRRILATTTLRALYRVFLIRRQPPPLRVPAPSDRIVRPTATMRLRLGVSLILKHPPQLVSLHSTQPVHSPFLR